VQGLDLLGRKVVSHGGAALRALLEDVEATCGRAARAGVDPAWIAAVRDAGAEIAGLTMHLGGLGLAGDAEGMLLHSADYLTLFSTWVVAWRWLEQAAAAREGLAEGRSSPGFYEGKLLAAQYWIRTELPHVAPLAALCREGEDSYRRIRDDAF
jgi:butyryl-CoA dehydrogenase